MIAVLPGQPQAKLQGVTTGFWDGHQYNAYISGHAFTVLSASHRVIQTVYDDDSEQQLDAIVLDEASGKIATCTPKQVRIYCPLALQDESVKQIRCLPKCDALATTNGPKRSILIQYINHQLICT